MNGKEALEKISWRYVNDASFQEWCDIIKQDLDRLEKLEKGNKILREKVNHFKNVKNRYRRNEKFVEKENAKLKKTIEILKDYFEIWLNYEEEEIFGGFEINGYHQINKQEYELLKEVLGK